MDQLFRLLFLHRSATIVAMAKPTQTIGSMLRSPTVQKLLAYVLPLLFGWILSKLDTKPNKKQ